VDGEPDPGSSLRDDQAYLNRIAALSFDQTEWTAERIRQTRDFLAPWNHNIRLADGICTAYCTDYYREHEQIMQVINHELGGEFAGRRVLDVGCLEGTSRSSARCRARRLSESTTVSST